MANPKNRYSDNVRGPYYVDSQCIDCDLCQNIAPAIFGRNAVAGHSIVKKQPVTVDQQVAAQEALDHCPVSAIGNDA